MARIALVKPLTRVLILGLVTCNHSSSYAWRSPECWGSMGQPPLIISPVEKMDLVDYIVPFLSDSPSNIGVPVLYFNTNEESKINMREEFYLSAEQNFPFIYAVRGEENIFIFSVRPEETHDEIDERDTFNIETLGTATADNWEVLEDFLPEEFLEDPNWDRRFFLGDNPRHYHILRITDVPD